MIAGADVTADGWLPHRGDYATEYADQLVELVEGHCCRQGQGCVHAGTDQQVLDHGPGGACPHLLELLTGDRCRVIRPTPGTPSCTAYEQRPLPTPPDQEVLSW